MTNPAELLFNQFTEWNNPKTSAISARNDVEDLAYHRRALHNLNDIRHLLGLMKNAGKRVGVYERAFPQWAKIIFNYPHSWQGTQTGKIDSKVMDDLENLIDAVQPHIAKLDSSKFEQITMYLDRAEKLLDEDESLDDYTRESARSTIENIRQAIEQFSLFGDFRLEQLLQQLLGQLALITIRSKKRSKWTDILNSFIIPYLVNQAPELPATGIVTALTEGNSLGL